MTKAAALGQRHRGMLQVFAFRSSLYLTSERGGVRLYSLQSSFLLPARLSRARHENPRDSSPTRRALPEDVCVTGCMSYHSSPYFCSVAHFPWPLRPTLTAHFTVFKTTERIPRILPSSFRRS